MSNKVSTILDGSNSFIEHRMLVYINNLLEATNPNSRLAARICRAAEEEFAFGDAIEFPAKKDPDADKDELYYSPQRLKAGGRAEPEDWENLKKYFADRLANTPEGEPDTLYCNLHHLADHLGLDDVGREVLNFIQVWELSPSYRDFISECIDGNSAKVPAAMARMIGQEGAVDDISDLISDRGALGKNKLIRKVYGKESSHTKDVVFPHIQRALYYQLSDRAMSRDEVVEELIGSPEKTDLSLDDFKYLGDDLAVMLEHIRNAIAEKKKGINILLYGPPGGGKTQLAIAIADALGLSTYAIAEKGKEEGGSSSSQKQTASEYRLASLKRAQALLRNNPQALVVFNEIEDLLIKGQDSEKKADTENKVEINDQLENNPVPVIWTGNNIEKFHQAVRQRFSYSMHVGPQPTLVRRNIWRKQLALHGQTLEDEQVLELARKYTAPARLIAKAVQGMALAGSKNKTPAQKREIIENHLRNASRIAFQHADAILVDERVPEGYSAELVNTGAGGHETVEGLISRAQAGKPFSLLVSGNAGTDPGALLRYMAEQSVTNIFEYPVAALVNGGPMSPPEANIRKVFAMAANDNDLLVLHGLEHLSDNPSGKKPGWDTRLVAIFKEAARHHKRPFAVTINSDIEVSEGFRAFFSHHLDMMPLSREQARAVYKVHFDSEAPAELDSLDELVMQDFADARRILEQRIDNPTGTQIVEQIARQKALRESQKKSDFGLAATRPLPG